MFSGSSDNIRQIKKELFDLKKAIERKATDDEREARQASKMCSEYKNRCLETKKVIDDISESTSAKLTQVKSDFDKIKIKKEEILGIGDEASTSLSAIQNLKEKVDEVERLFEEKSNLDSKIESLTELYDSGKDISLKINSLHTLSKGKKEEIDEIYYEIYGYEEDEEDTDSESGSSSSNHVEGLKDKLESSYQDIVSRLKKLEEDVSGIDAETEIKYSEFIEREEDKYSLVHKKIRDLLPEALTAGLSHAYSKKKESEIEDSQKLKATFLNAIRSMVAVSLIPFAVNIYLFINGKTIELIINDLPKMVFSILPLYIPIVWLAYSAGKKVNLSKRLIEEYSHKEVLSKTFEGLSSQIADIEDETISTELKIKLLRNILTVSAENPGKLISDYNSADHPILDANIPGLSEAKKVENKVSKVIDDVVDE